MRRKCKPESAPGASLDLSYAQAATLLVRNAPKLRLVQVGCGGTGSWLAAHVARIASEARHRWEVAVTLVDPDLVEAKNIPRQNFVAAEIGCNKAIALARRYTAWGIEIGAVPARFEGVQADWNALTILIGCVDNAAARITIAESVHRTLNPPNVWWLDCGNARDSGQVLLGAAAKPADLKDAFKLGAQCTTLPSPALVQPGLLEALPEETAGHRLSCAELAAANAQSLTINNAIAGLAADYLVRMVFGGLRRFATYLDLGSGTARSEYITPERVAAAVGQSPVKLFGK